MDWFWDTFSNYNAPRYVAEKSYDYLTQFQAAPTVELPPKGAVMLRIDEKHHAVASLIYDEIARFSRIKPGQSEKKEGA